jgi:hypothetical protein
MMIAVQEILLNEGPILIKESLLSEGLHISYR